MQKAWAKINGNFENIAHHNWDVNNHKELSGMLGVPVFFYGFHDLNSSIYEMLNNALLNKYVV